MSIKHGKLAFVSTFSLISWDNSMSVSYRNMISRTCIEKKKMNKKVQDVGQQSRRQSGSSVISFAILNCREMKKKTGGWRKKSRKHVINDQSYYFCTKNAIFVEKFLVCKSSKILQ